MKSYRLESWLRLILPGAVLLGFGGCLGPNPLFFVSTSAANATIMTLTNLFLTNVLGIGGG